MNKQVVESKTSNRNVLDVIDIWRTIQGEGPYAGCPAIFVRLAGCDLACSFCDTDYTTGREKMSIEKVVEKINALSDCKKFFIGIQQRLIVMTGGEPFRQEGLFSLCDRLIGDSIIQIETNGRLLDRSVADYIFGMQEEYSSAIKIVCSPKTKEIGLVSGSVVTHWKYVLEAGKISEHDGLPNNVARPTNTEPIFVQPVMNATDVEGEEEYKANLEACIDVCMKYGYRLSLQTHKLIGMP